METMREGKGDSRHAANAPRFENSLKNDSKEYNPE